jgi:hypothetical protein
MPALGRSSWKALAEKRTGSTRKTTYLPAARTASTRPWGRGQVSRRIGPGSFGERVSCVSSTK